MPVTAPSSFGYVAPYFDRPDEADQQGAPEHDSATDNGGEVSARNPRDWLSNFEAPSGIAAQIQAQTRQASPTDKNSPESGTQHADDSGATATSANTATRDNPQAVDEMGQPLNGPSHYDAWTQFGKIWSDNDSLGGKLSQTWKWLNYSAPDATQQRQAYIDRMNAEDAKWATVDAIRGSGFAGIAVTGGVVAGASPETIARLAQTGAVLEGITGSVTGAYQQTLTAKAPLSIRVAARPQEPGDTPPLPPSVIGTGMRGAIEGGAVAAKGGTAAESHVLNAPVYNSQGAARATANRGNWSSGSLSETVQNMVGSNPQVTHTASGKTVYANPTSGMSVVYDNAGNYYRVQNAAGQYLDRNGNVIPNNIPLINPTKTTQMGVPSGVRNSLTHFNNTDPIK